MFKKNVIDISKKLLEYIQKKKTQDSLENAKQLFEEMFGKRFADEIDKNGILRYKSLTGSGENIQYFGILYENAPQSGVYENFSLVLFPDNTENPSQLLLCYGIGTGGITEDAEWLGIPWIKRTIRLLLKFIKKEQWHAEGTEVFVKDDVTDEYSEIPGTIKKNLGNFSGYAELWRKYGKFLPSVCVIEPNKKELRPFFLTYSYMLNLEIGH